MKKKLVVFTTNNAKVLVNADERRYPNALVNPDLSRVRGTPPQYWKREGDKVMPMSPPEKLIREWHIQTYGLDSNLEPQGKHPITLRRAILHTRYLFPNWLLAWGLGLLMGALGAKWLTSGLGILGL